MEDPSKSSKKVGTIPHSRSQTLQQAHRATAIETLKISAPLFSFKKKDSKIVGNGHARVTIAAASREQAIRLYAGPTVRSAGAWDAPRDGPGPQAHDDIDKWISNFSRRTPSARFAIAKRERDSTLLPTAPGPGDYDVAHPGIGEEGRRPRFGDPEKRKRYPPRTPEQSRARAACSYAEHISCLDHQVTSNRTRSPTVRFGKAIRFKETSVSRRDIPNRVTPVSPPKPPDPRSRSNIPIAHGIVPQRGKKRRSKRRGSRRLRIFRRGDYGWLIRCMESKQFQPSLNLTENRPPSVDPSKARALTEREAPRPVLRRGPRSNPAQYNPQRRDLPREADVLPGPKYDRPPGAFGRTGGGGGTVAPSASVSTVDRFPRCRLFAEEDIGERENTPGPGAYDVALGYRFEGEACLGAMTRSLETLASLGVADVGAMSNWPFAGIVGGGHGCEGCQHDDHQRFRRSGAVPGSRGVASGDGGIDEGSSAGGAYYGRANHEKLSGIVSRSRTPCSAGGRGQLPPKRSASAPIPWRGRCSWLTPAVATAVTVAAVEREGSCPTCLEFNFASASDAFVAASSSPTNSNVVKRSVQTAGASGAPAFTFGGGSARDLSSRLLHIPGETIYKEVRLGRSGPGPSTAVLRAGERLARPRSRDKRTARLGETGSGRMSSANTKHNLLGRSAAASAEAEEENAAKGAQGSRAMGGWAVDGALGTQVKSGRPTSPSYTLAGPRRAVELFHERIVYGGKELSSAERDRAEPRCFFDSHIPRSTPALELPHLVIEQGMNAPPGASNQKKD